MTDEEMNEVLKGFIIFVIIWVSLIILAIKIIGD
jgi:hypothetical protein